MYTAGFFRLSDAMRAASTRFLPELRSCSQGTASCFHLRLQNLRRCEFVLSSDNGQVFLLSNPRLPFTATIDLEINNIPEIAERKAFVLRSATPWRAEATAISYCSCAGRRRITAAAPSVSSRGEWAGRQFGGPPAGGESILIPLPFLALRAASLPSTSKSKSAERVCRSAHRRHGTR